MKLTGKLLLLTVSISIFTQLVVGKANFPARGFSPILDDFEADQIVSTLRESLFSRSSRTIFHQAYLYQFHFIHYPKSGQPVVHYGLLSGPSPQSTSFRIDLFAAQFDTVPQASFLLLRDQNNSQVWKFKNSQNNPIVLEPKDWLSPWKKGVNHTPFDLLMPFINWSFEYEKSGRVCGRPAHLFKFFPSSSDALPNNLKAVRLAVDDAYDAPLRIEHMDGGILPAREFTLQSFKKVDDQWVVKAIDTKDRDSGSRTRFELQSVAHALDLDPMLFQIEGLRIPINHSSVSFVSL